MHTEYIFKLNGFFIRRYTKRVITLHNAKVEI